MVQKTTHSVVIIQGRRGQEEIHRAGCADLKKARTDLWLEMETDSIAAAACELFADMLDEESMTEDDAVNALRVLPCANKVPMYSDNESHHGSAEPLSNPAMDRLRTLVAQADEPTFMTTGGIIRNKTAKRIEREHAVATEVVRFAFDHAGITGGHLAPTGLYIQLLEESRNS